MKCVFQEDRNVASSPLVQIFERAKRSIRRGESGRTDGLDLEQEQRVAGRRRRRRQLRHRHLPSFLPSPLCCRPGPPPPHSCCSRLFSPTEAVRRKQRASRRRLSRSTIKNRRTPTPPKPPPRGQQAMTAPTQVREEDRRKEGRETVCFARVNARLLFPFRPFVLTDDVANLRMEEVFFHSL